MKVALFSPLSPLKTAIADHTEGLLPFWREQVDITVVTSGDYRPTHALFQPGSAGAIPWISYRDFQRQPSAFDLVVYQLGDEARLHGYMFDALASYPGLVVLHDLVLHHAIAALTLSRGNTTAYLAELLYSYGEQGKRLAAEVLAGNGDTIFNRYPLVERVLDQSVGVIVHNDYARREVATLRPALPVTRILQHFFLPPQAEPEEAPATLRRQRGLPTGPLLASFGLFLPDKRLGLCLRAFQRVRERHSEAHYLLVGSAAPGYDLQAELRAQGLSESVHLTGWQAPPDFVSYMRAVDLAIHLRYPHIGGTPYTPIRLLGLGVPTIISAIEPLEELPADAVVRIQPDAPDEEGMLVAALDYLLTHPEVGRAMGARGRAYVAANHDQARIAAAYVDVMRATAREMAAGRLQPASQRGDAGRLAAVVQARSQRDEPPSANKAPLVPPAHPAPVAPQLEAPSPAPESIALAQQPKTPDSETPPPPLPAPIPEGVPAAATRGLARKLAVEAGTTLVQLGLQAPSASLLRGVAAAVQALATPPERQP